jgi:outer membrane protein assembly factor BamB
MKTLLLGRLGLGLGLAICLGLGCASLTTRTVAPPDDRVAPAGVVHVRWRVELHAHQLFEARPEECAVGVVAGGRLVIGSRAGSMVGVSTANGHIDWATAATGGIDSEARLDPEHGQVYMGADDGSFYAIEPATGRIRWTYRAKGAIDERAELGGDTVYLASSADQVIALDARTGKWRWQYDRETPDGFTIHGYGGPRLHGNQLLEGFADGFLVSLQISNGEVAWAHGLAGTSEQFVDVDSTPVLDGQTVLAASYSGGVYALDLKDGATRWRAPIEGVGPLSLIDGRIYFASPRSGLHALAKQDGQILWRQGLPDAGDMTAPQAVGRFLVFSGSRGGLFVVEPATGRLLEVFNPGNGVCAGGTYDPATQRFYLLSNGGTLYALDID